MKGEVLAHLALRLPRSAWCSTSPRSIRYRTRCLVGSILECSPSLLDCRTPELVFVRVPYDPADPALFASQRVREFRVAPDGVHIGWTQGRSAVPLTLIPVIGELRRELDHYELDDVEVLISRAPAMQPRADGTFDFHLPTSGEIKRFSEGGASIALFDPEEAFNGDPALLDVATGGKRRLTHHPDYDEPIDLSPDGQWLAVGSKRSADPAFDVLAAFALIERPPFVDLAGAVLYAGWAFAGNGNRNRGLDTWLLDRRGSRGEYIGQPLSDDFCYGGFERQHWNADGTRIAKREQLRPARIDAPECQGLPARRVVVYELSSRTSIPPAERFRVVSTPDAPWAVGITDVKDAPPVEAGVYTVRGRIFGEARVDLARVGTSISVEDRSYSDDGLAVLDGRESLSVEAASVPYTAQLRLSGCRAGSLEAGAALEGTSVTAVFAPLRGSVSSQVGGLIRTGDPIFPPIGEPTYELELQWPPGGPAVRDSAHRLPGKPLSLAVAAPRARLLQRKRFGLGPACPAAGIAVNPPRPRRRCPAAPDRDRGRRSSP